MVGASGVNPTTWYIGTFPPVFSSAPRFMWASGVMAAMPVNTGMKAVWMPEIRGSA